MARTKKLEQDEPLKFARSVLSQIIARHDPESVKEQGKNPQKVAAGTKGGLKGGRKRAETLSTQKRKAIAKKAANVRWRSRDA
jgi:hypothetical protein